MARSVVIVQARFGSSRLRGKVLEVLRGRTVLSHVLERCGAVSLADEVCCAVPIGEADDPVANEGTRCGAMVVRGSESDVLDRYLKAATECECDFVMRVTSDCPLLDPALADRVLSCVVEGKADYACNNMPRTWPHGLDCEAFTFDWLKRAANEARDPYEREHVTPFLRSHPETRKQNVPGSRSDLALYRWTLDTPADLVFMQTVFGRLPAGRQSFDYRAVLQIVESDPVLKAHRNPE